MRPWLVKALVLASCWNLVIAAVHADQGYRVVSEGRQFVVDVAISRHDRQRGLMYKKKLAPNGGLLIILPEMSRTAVWMKNVQFPLDVIWVAGSGEISDIRSLPPCKTDPCPIYWPRAAAKYILEVAQGSFPGKIGDRIAIFDASGDSLLP
jgi:uncharacterized membrane protein (UPF0127 family)